MKLPPLKSRMAPNSARSASASWRGTSRSSSRSSQRGCGSDATVVGAVASRRGGFLKRSWRVNDWIWGRADGATVLCRTLLDPKRIRRTAQLSGYMKTPAVTATSSR